MSERAEPGLAGERTSMTSSERIDPSSSLSGTSQLSSSSAHRAQPSSASSSSYAPVLINPTSDYALDDDTLTPDGQAQAVQLSLRYPYPLPIASILDLAYTLHHQYHFISLLSISAQVGPAIQAGDTEQNGPSIKAPTVLLLTGAISRAIILVGVVGCSKRWRSRGGWVAAVCGISVGAGIWEDCAERLGARGGGTRQGTDKGGQSWFLYMTILICASEYLLYLLLLRLSPPSHRSLPFSLRHPSAPRQTDVPFAYQSEELDYSPRSVRYRRYSSARSAGARRLFPVVPARAALGEAGPSRSNAQRERQGEDSDENHGPHYRTHHQHQSSRRRYSTSSSHSDFSNFTDTMHDDDDDNNDDYDEGDETASQSSSISQSSIIDLPPPLSPNCIIAPSISVQSGLSLAQPILGGIVKRSKSARFLGRSWGSGVLLSSPPMQVGEGRYMNYGRGEGGSGSRGGAESRDGSREGRRERGEGEDETERGYGTFQA